MLLVNLFAKTVPRLQSPPAARAQRGSLLSGTRVLLCVYQRSRGSSGWELQDGLNSRTLQPAFPHRGLRRRSRGRAAAAPGRRRGPTGSLGRRGGAGGPAAGRARSRSGDVGRRRREEAAAPSRSRCSGSAAGTARAAAEGREGQGQPHGALPAAGGSGGGPVGCSGWTSPPAAPSGRRTPRLPDSAPLLGGCSGVPHGRRVPSGPAVRPPPVTIAARVLPTSGRGCRNREGREVVDASGRKLEVFPQESRIRSGQSSLFYFSLPRKIWHLELSFLHRYFTGDKS